MSNPEDPAIPAPAKQRGIRIPIPTRTAPVLNIQGNKVLVALDFVKLILHADELEYRLDLGRLAEIFHSLTDRCDLRLFVDPVPEDAVQLATMFAETGWTTVKLPSGVRPVAFHTGALPDQEAFMLCVVGGLLKATEPDVVVLGTSDGSIVLSLTQAVRVLRLRTKVMAMALPGASAVRLAPRNPDLLAGNIVLGKDVLRPYSAANKNPFAYVRD